MTQLEIQLEKFPVKSVMIWNIKYPEETVVSNMIVVSIKKRYPGQAKKVMFAIWGTGQMMILMSMI